MKITFSKQYMIDNKGCYDIETVTSLFFSDSDSDITIDTIVNCGIPLKDKFWFLIKKCDLTIRQKQQIAIDVAEIVLPIYETRYNNSAPREAIQAAKLFLSGHILLEELIVKRNAAAAAAYAAAAYAAADAAAYAAADAAAYAADAAAAYAAADAAAAYAAAAYAAAAAAYAAAAAAYAAAYKNKLQTYLVEFVNNLK